MGKDHLVKADTLTPQNLFGQHIRYVVPLFQRPYVWNREDQWEPLWMDVRSLTERLRESPRTQDVAAHFLGAIVLDQAPTGTAYIQVRHVVDGQQRLTTLQLLLDATQAVAETHGEPTDAEALRVLVLNQPSLTKSEEEVYKVWPTDRDQGAFVQAMDNGSVPDPESQTQPIAAAHAYFQSRVEGWAGAGVLAADEVRDRLHALTMALHSHLKLVVIDLEAGDNAQVIFETLNHRGSPLLAADLIKNLVFQRAIAQGLDARDLYDKYWKDLDDDYWRTKVSRGRQYVPRIDIFANYWLIMQLTQEVPTDRIFADFRDLVAVDGAEIEAILAEMANDASRFAAWDELPTQGVPGRFRYRVLQAMNAGVLTPVFMWLTRWPETVLPEDQRDKALDALESWITRRVLCRYTIKDLNRLALDLLKRLKEADIATAGDVTEEFLLGQTSDSRLWPADEMVSGALASEKVYTSLLRARLRMVLEALEDERRTDYSEAPCPRGLTVEHIMPQAWREHWNEGLDETEALERDGVIQTLGNLTLVNGKLNSHLSNFPWSAEAAEARGLGNAGGKRTKLMSNSTIKLNADVVGQYEDSWTEADIRERTDDLTASILKIWARPASSVLPPSARAALDSEAEESPDNLDWSLLIGWLLDQSSDQVPVAFPDLEDVMGAELPAEARARRDHWVADTALSRALEDAGFRATGLDLTKEMVVLQRAPI